MKKNNIFKTILHGIINFFKIIITYITNIISIFLPSSNKSPEKKLKNITQEKIDSNNNTNIANQNESIPDSQDTKINPDSDSTNAINEPILSITNHELNKLIKNHSIKNFLFDEKEFDLLFNRIFEKVTEIDLEKCQKDIKEKIDEIKEKIIEEVKDKIINQEIKTKDDLEEDIEKQIKDKIKEEKIFNKDKKSTKKNKNIYVIATPMDKKLNLPDKEPIKKQTTILEKTSKDVAKEIKTETLEKPLVVVPLVEKIPKVNIKATSVNVLKTAALTTAAVSLDLVSSLLQPNKKEETNAKASKKTITPPLPESKKEAITKNKEDLLESKEENKAPETIETQKEEKKEEETVTKQDTKTDKPKEEPKNENKKAPEQQSAPEEEIILQLEKSTSERATIFEELETESNKEDFEDKDYEYLEEKIDRLLYNIELLLIKNEKNLNSKTKERILKERDYLWNLKNNLRFKKEVDINAEKQRLEENITENEIKGLKDELEKMKIEHQLDLNNNLIKEVEDLDYLTQDKLAKVEKNLIKQKLRRACRAIEIPSILALPFIRNRFFFMFTTGLFINNHFNFLNGILRHKTTDITTPDLDRLQKGKDALTSAIDITYDNISYLNYLEVETLTKYPELALDAEYLIYISTLRNKLTRNYEKLLKKRDNIDKYITKGRFFNKKLKNKKAA